MMLVELNRPPFAAASHTSSNSSVRDVARTIASLVALSAASMRASRSFWASALAFSLARSKLSSANETFSAIRAISATISSSSAHVLPTKNSNTPMLSLGLDQRNGDAGGDAGLARGLMPGLPLRRVEDIVVDAGFCVRNALPQTPVSIRVAGVDRERRPHDLFDDLARPGDRLQPDRVRLAQAGPPWPRIFRCIPRHRKPADRVPVRSWREEWLRWSR